MDNLADAMMRPLFWQAKADLSPTGQDETKLDLIYSVRTFMARPCAGDNP